jgi:hypothetical protein
VGSDNRERCMWVQKTEEGVRVTRCPREVYEGSNARDRCREV